LLQEQVGDEELEAFEFGVEFSELAGLVDPGGVEALPPAELGGLGDAELSADVGDGQPLGPVAGGLLSQPLDLLGRPSFGHLSLLGLAWDGTTISAGPSFGEQTTAAFSI